MGKRGGLELKEREEALGDRESGAPSGGTWRSWQRLWSWFISAKGVIDGFEAEE